MSHGSLVTRQSWCAYMATMVVSGAANARNGDKEVVQFVKVDTANNLADLNSKCHQRGPFKRLVHMILDINAKRK